MKFYCIHEVSADRFATHIQVNDGHSRLLATLPETLTKEGLANAIASIIKDAKPAKSTFAAPSHSIVKHLKKNKKKKYTPFIGPVPLRVSIIELMENSPLNKEWKANQIHGRPQFRNYKPDSIKQALYDLMRSNQIMRLRSGVYSLPPKSV